MDGLILVDKPQNITSHDAVLRVRRILSTSKVGHFGTLDPMATGLLLVAVGRATKLFPFFSRQDKVYSGRIRLGFSTDSYDATGHPTSAEAARLPETGEVALAMAKFKGTIEQVPPAYSAKKLSGRPLYKWARANVPVLLSPVTVHVHSFDLRSYVPPYVDFESRCSSGTYIRSLAYELGRVLGCGAHLAALRRHASGAHRVPEARSLDEIERLAGEGNVAVFLLPLEVLLPHLPKAILGESDVRGLQKGKPIPAERIVDILPPGPGHQLDAESRGICRVFTTGGKFIALARASAPDQPLVPFLLL
jgi:tRNA pseudouridine55 synthase